LSEKIKKLEQQTDNINVFKNESNVTNKHSMTNIEANGGHSRELLMTIEKKIQLIVKETKRIVDKLG
jgi:IS1 family transposase